VNRNAILFFLGVISVSVLGWVAMGAARRGVTEQPIAFNHKLHKEAGVDCIDCHQFFETQRFAGKPSIEVCLECHEEPMTESPEEGKIQDYAKESREIPWKKLYQLEDHVFFTHQRHVVGAGMECEICHGKIGEATAPLRKPLKTLSMNDCMDCHRKKEANNDCLACHW
jgi:hypothetical protein